jgi:GNAT superfamily N-acetyltransferase
VGSVQTRAIDGETAWFGGLAVEPARAGRGIGGALVRFAENRARTAGARTMELELLVPLDGHPHKELLAAWHGRLGYREVDCRALADEYPEVIPFLAVPAEISVMRKPLA